MGYLALYDMLDNAGPDIALDWHLSNNIYPRLQDGAREAVYKVYDRIKSGLYAPEEPIEWRMANNDYSTDRASSIVKAVHLECFIQWFEEHPEEVVKGA